MRSAGLPLASYLRGGAPTKHARISTTAVFCAQTLAVSIGDAARHGARLLSAAVFAAIRRSRVCVGGASFKLARSIRAVLFADTACLRKRGAAFLLAHFPAATAVLFAPASCFGGSGAIVERAVLSGAVFIAQPACVHLGGAAVDRAWFAAMFHTELAFATAYARAAICYAHLLLLPPPSTLAPRAVFVAQPACLRLGGAAVDRAGFAAMFHTERAPFQGGDARAAIRHAHLLLLPRSPLLFLICQQL